MSDGNTITKPESIEDIVLVDLELQYPNIDSLTKPQGSFKLGKLVQYRKKDEDGNTIEGEYTLPLFTTAFQQTSALNIGGISFDLSSSTYTRTADGKIANLGGMNKKNAQKWFQRDQLDLLWALIEEGILYVYINVDDDSAPILTPEQYAEMSPSDHINNAIVQDINNASELPV